MHIQTPYHSSILLVKYASSSSFHELLCLFEEEMVMAANFQPTFGGMQVLLTSPVDLCIFCIQVLFVPCTSVMCADAGLFIVSGLQLGALLHAP